MTCLLTGKEQEYKHIDFQKDVWHKSAKITKKFALVSCIRILVIQCFPTMWILDLLWILYMGDLPWSRPLIMGIKKLI